MAPHGPFMPLSTTSVPMIDFPMQFNSHATQYWTYTIAPLNGDGRAGEADGQTTTHARTLSVQLQLTVYNMAAVVSSAALRTHIYECRVDNTSYTSPMTEHCWAIRCVFALYGPA